FSVPIDYEAQEGPKLAIRVQELFGLDRHPTIAAGRGPPRGGAVLPGPPPGAGAPRPPPVLRRRHPPGPTSKKGPASPPPPPHPWPDDPLSAVATRRAKPRSS